MTTWQRFGEGIDRSPGCVRHAQRGLIKAIAKAQELPDEPAKDVNAIHAVKQDIRALQKRSGALTSTAIASSEIKRKVKLLKRLTRHLAHETKTAAAAKAAAPAPPTPPPAAPAAPQAAG
jgi:hypothetical protein